MFEELYSIEKWSANMHRHSTALHFCDPLKNMCFISSLQFVRNAVPALAVERSKSRKQGLGKCWAERFHHNLVAWNRCLLVICGESEDNMTTLKQTLPCMRV